jgi:protein-S-isoprenylcysteine O-methyltransferase Ste14
MSPLLKLAIFCLFTILIVIVSWRSLRVLNSHGFTRFLTWECIATLLTLNLDHWFVAPLSLPQIISWILLCASLIPLVFGVKMLVTRGKAVQKREGEPQLLAFEKTTELVTSGIYKYIRHPMYSSLLLLTWGIFFKNITWQGGLLALASTAFLFLTARADETECIQFFGTAYQEYMKHSKRFIPFIF